MFDKFKSLFTTKTNAKSADVSDSLLASSLGFTNTLACYKNGSYDNNFPSITRIAEQFSVLLPYAVNEKGERIRKNPNLINVLYNPNREMAGVDFFEALMVMALVHPRVYVLCWHNEKGEAVAGGPITPENLAGFTFLENPSVVRQNGKVFYRSGSLSYTDDEVIAISMNANPYSLVDGYSPSVAAKKWSNIDDYIADYQAGFFKNGAVPAGQFVITAPSKDSYMDIVRNLQHAHRGAGNNNNVVYTHRPISALDGQPANAQVEWIPFSQSNKDMTLQQLFDQANKKIDMDFGVPQEIKGYLENSNYASANVAEHIFDKYVVLPKATKLWAKFTHELNRITGGLGFAISFDFEASGLADEDKVRAETRNVELGMLTNALNSGFTIESAVKALGLPQSFLDFEKTTAPDEQEVAEVVANDETTVSQAETSGKCFKKVLTETKYKLPDADPELEQIVRDYMRKQVDSAVAEQEFDDEQEALAFASAMMTVLIATVQKNGTFQFSQGSLQAMTSGYDTNGLDKYTVSQSTKNGYQKYLDDVSLSYTQDTADAIKRVLAQAETEGLGFEETRIKLREVMDTDEWRVQRLARTETHRAEQLGQLDAMKDLQDQLGIEITKTWHINPGSRNVCGACQDMDGKEMPVDADFVDGEISIEEANLHPNCNCYLTFNFKKAEKKSVAVKCPNCGRFLYESNGGEVSSMKCQGCKKHFDIKVANGKVKALEAKND